MEKKKKEEIVIPEEFKIQLIKGRPDTIPKGFNEEIFIFRQRNPDYEIFAISTAGTGGQLGGTIRSYVFWRKK